MTQHAPTIAELAADIVGLRARLAAAEAELSVYRTSGPASSALERLRISETRYRRLFEAARDGVILIDPATHKIVDANPYITELLGYEHADLIGKELFEIGVLGNAEASREMFQKLLTERYVRYETLPLLSRRGVNKAVEVVANLYDEDGHAIIQCNIRDIALRRAAEDHDQDMMAEVNHRSMNLLAVVQAVIHQTSRTAENSDFAQRLMARIRGLAASQDLLAKSQWLGVDVGTLVRAQLAHFGDLLQTRIMIDGPDFRFTPAVAQSIGMVIHELATNAGKYGSLSTDTGQIRVTWAIDAGEPPMFVMTWLEQGGPLVTAPTRSGFGQLVVRRMVETATAGKVVITYPRTGVAWTLRAPITAALRFPDRALSKRANDG